jgi:hypothetical protein
MDWNIDYSAALDRIVANARMRRELLWLLAKDKGDEGTVLDLEIIEPGLAEHMQRLVAEFRARDEREEVDFGRLYDERFAIRAAEVTRAAP